MTACPWIIAKRLHAACVLSCVFSGCTWARLCILQVWTNSYWDRTRCRHCHTKQQRHANLRMRISLCLFVCAYITERTKKQRTDLLHKVDDFSLLLLWLRTCRNSVVLWSIWSEARTREREMSRINMRWIDKWDGSLCVRVRACARTCVWKSGSRFVLRLQGGIGHIQTVNATNSDHRV